MPSWEAVATFLRGANPSAYGSSSSTLVPDATAAGAACEEDAPPPPSASQLAALDDAANGIFAMMTAAAAKSPSGLVPASECPIFFSDSDVRNVWALQGRFNASSRTVHLPFANMTVEVRQRWNEHGEGGRRQGPTPQAAQLGAGARRTPSSTTSHEEISSDEIEGHSTAAVCWDGSVVLAELLCLPPPVLLSHSANLARSPAVYAEWRWDEKTVIELGCGIAALPSLAASRRGARRVVCTDGNADVLRTTHANVQRWRHEHADVASVEPPLMMPLQWGDGEAAKAALHAAGVGTPVDVILAADCIYVLDNPGAWGKLLRTIVALSTPRTLIFVTYTDRGHNKMWERFVAQRVETLFHIVRVGEHLLHPMASPGASGRLETFLNQQVQVFCWALKDADSTTT